MYGMPTAWRVPGYTEIRELGAGASGRVVMARHDADGTLVAIKYLSDELRGDAGFVARFRHEARLLHRLNSANAVRLYDYLETGEGAAIVMELVDGVPLRALLRSEGPTGPEAALVVLKGSLMGLAAAHRAGIVHRDFKPENVMVEAEGSSKLVDFGIALPSGDGGSPAGTPPYMAPEQWAGAPASPATDVYAATVVFFECLTGTRPFRAQTLAALARQHQATPPPSEEVPPALRGLVERGLAKNPADRPSTATAFLSELEAVAAEAYGPDWQERGRRRLAALAALLAGLFPRQPETPEVDTSLAETILDEDAGRPRFGRVEMKIAVAAGCVAVVTGLAVALLGFGDDPELKTQSSVAVPSTPAETAGGEEPTEEPVEEPAEEPADEPAPDGSEPSATPAATGTAPPPAVPTGTAAPAAAPTAAPTTRPSRRPSARPTAKPSATPTEEDSGLGGPYTVTSRPVPPGSTSSPSQTAGPTRTIRPTRIPPFPTPTRTGSEPSPSVTRTDPSPSSTGGGDTTPDSPPTPR
ncbi:protein kinase [Planomonospora corallina]|uniref:non-specific serine/threonine protein kinase n=1 Tax=Planomonospora corallina TaxID=1806052 RepID=A0ABV8I8Y0_9ACTN